MTEKDKKRVKRKSRRSSTKYPALKKGLNLLSRKEFIEADYINGIVNDDGEMAIRPLNDAEKAWLNQFYEETVITNFNYNPEIRKIKKMISAYIEDDTVKELKKQIKCMLEETHPNYKRISEMREVLKLAKKQNRETYAESIEDLEEKLKKLQEETLLYPDKEDHKIFYNENNKRNACIYNRSNITGNLTFLDEDGYDEIIGPKYRGLDAENIYVHQLERSKYEDEEDRLKEVKRQEKNGLKELNREQLTLEKAEELGSRSQESKSSDGESDS